jgi:hypothetical protein
MYMHPITYKESFKTNIGVIFWISVGTEADM